MKRCALLFNQDDDHRYRGIEALTRAKSSKNPDERLQALQYSLKVPEGYQWQFSSPRLIFSFLGVLVGSQGPRSAQETGSNLQ